MSLMQDIRYKMTRLNFAEKLIVVNVIIFVAPLLLRSILFLFKIALPDYFSWFEVDSNLKEFITKPWTLVTYSFFHLTFGHIFWNMVILYLFTNSFFNLFDSRRFINVFFLGVIAGGLLFISFYNIFPVFENHAEMIGASAGVNAVCIFMCTYSPNSEFRFFSFRIKFWWIGVFVLLKDFIGIAGDNSGGAIAHLGGAAIGFFLARGLLNGKDYGEWFSKLIDGFSSMFQPEKRSPLKTVHKQKTKKTTAKKQTKTVDQQKIDTILDKISKSGYESLTKQEKDFLFQAGKDN
ncbi:rhomboid family intramembrane serine protease [Spongiivirga citrea]|uniref:Rhomboid family intramembrane serine protease n=1 Tax=Spongiivirga citrea TaxID=1481457 RepID=A0A6M0CIB8_9FLAO|nr:rhomboid family intramembrane serine protease [Spongiivirga citrea]NER15679.1 rhomboid family intramembrane serine protease [Spongiivirga citrea]